jgi:proteasome activator subunit 3 (PA28 gamma)
VVDLNIPVPPSEEVKNGGETDSKKRKLEKEDDLEGSKVYVLPGGVVKTNPNITELLRVVKPHLRQLVQDTNLLKMWIRLAN